MGIRSTIRACLLAAVLLTPSAVSAQSGSRCIPIARLSASTDHEQIELQVFKLVNAERKAHKLKALIASPMLAQSARRHSRDMATANFFDHIGSDRSDLTRRITDVCYPYMSAAENIAAGYGGDVKAMVKGWMKSQPHRAAILSRDYTEAGVGYAVNPDSAYTHYYTLNFGQPLTRR